MRNLFIINTYFQLLVALKLKMSLFKDDCNVLILTNRSLNSYHVFTNLKSNNVFDEVYYFDYNNTDYRSSLYKQIKDVFDFSFLNNNRFKCFVNDVDNKSFDRLIFYNFGIDIVGLYYYLLNFNTNIIPCSMEESIFSYNCLFHDSFKQRIIGNIRLILNKKYFKIEFKNFYCFYPEYYDGNFNCIRIPPFDTNDAMFRNILINVFNVGDLSYYSKYKFIFFTSSWESDGYFINETSVFNKLMLKFDKNQVLLKLHPRNLVKYFIDNNYMIDVNSQVPFEVIQLIHNFDNHVFVTILSSSVISINILLENPPKLIFLYNLVDYKYNEYVKSVFENSISVIEKLINIGILKNCFIPKTYDELINCLSFI